MSVLGSTTVKEGDLLAGKYRVEQVLGAGGMGIVVRARHEQLDQLVAIKFVHEDALGKGEAVERFLREARAAVKLRSEHAARVLDVGTLESGAPYMVMEYLEGSDLGAVLQEGPLPVEMAADYVVQACEAVAEAHAAGIVHRDLKPQNLFLARALGSESRVKVLDFGVSKSLVQGSGRLTQTRTMLGSPLYMSPEQMRSARDVDARADVWALGVVLFELLTQRWPYEAESLPELCMKVVSEPPQSVTAMRPDVPRAMADVIERCLRQAPAERFANAAELAAALEPLASPASRVTVERARLAMGGTGRGPMVGLPLIASAETANPHVASTPAAWGSAPLASAPEKKRRGVWVGGGVALLGVVAAVGGVLLARGAGSPLPPVAASVPNHVQVAVQAPAAAVIPSAPASAVLNPAPADVAPPTVIAPSTPALPSAAPAMPAMAKPGATPPRNPGPKSRPKDDDIPSLR